jgi:hypothetical protein
VEHFIDSRLKGERMPRPPNFKQEKKRREEAQKKRNEQKQQEKATRKGVAEPEPFKTS